MDKITNEKITKIEKYLNLLKKALNSNIYNYAEMLADDISAEARDLWRHIQKLKETDEQQGGKNNE